MNIDATTSTASVDAALAYLASRGALEKLALPCPIMYRDIVMWTPPAYDLPPLTVRSI
jgi:hypothetical protein